MTTNSDSKKTNNLVANPKVSLLVHDCKQDFCGSRAYAPMRLRGARILSFGSSGFDTAARRLPLVCPPDPQLDGVANVGRRNYQRHNQRIRPRAGTGFGRGNFLQGQTTRCARLVWWRRQRILFWRECEGCGGGDSRRADQRWGGKCPRLCDSTRGEWPHVAREMIELNTDVPGLASAPLGEELDATRRDENNITAYELLGVYSIASRHAAQAKLFGKQQRHGAICTTWADLVMCQYYHMTSRALSTIPTICNASVSLSTANLLLLPL